jgi:predicted SprT family Zn-dependent metalloprotease
MTDARQTILQQMFDELNGRLFEGRLAAVKAEFSERMTSAAGRYFPRRKLIRLSVPYLRLHGWDKCRKTLIHEMIHAWLDVQGRPCGHTPEFRRLLRQLTGETSIYHHEDMRPYSRPYQHVYECPNGHKIYRKNRIRRAASCGLCAGTFDARFLLRHAGRIGEE